MLATRLLLEKDLRVAFEQHLLALFRVLAELVHVQAVGLVVTGGCFHVVGFLDLLVFYCLDEQAVLFELEVFLELDFVVVQAAGDFLEFVLDGLGHSLRLAPDLSNRLLHHVFVQRHIVGVLLNALFPFPFHQFHQAAALQVF